VATVRETNGSAGRGRAPRSTRPPAPSALLPLERRNLTDDVHESLTGLIMDHAIPPSTKVSIDELARQLNVSQTPVREALARLEEAGLVRKEPLRGYFTTPLLNRVQFEELYEFRRHLEPWAAGKAAQLRTTSGIHRLDTEMSTAGDLPDGADYESYKILALHDSRFHSLIFELAGNQVMGEAYRRTACHLHLFRLYYGTDLASPAAVEHRAIQRAIAEGDAAAATEAMLEHINASHDRLAGAAH